MSQSHGEFLNTGDRREPVWATESAEPHSQQRWTVDPNDAYVYEGRDHPRRTGWGHLLRLLAMSLGLGTIAALLSVVTDRWTGGPALLLLFPGLLAGIGAAYYGIVFWWRFFQRSWWQALFWLLLSVSVKAALYVALHPQY